MSNQVLIKLRRVGVKTILAGVAKILGGDTSILEMDADAPYKSALVLTALLLAGESFPAILKIAQEQLAK